MQDVLEALAQAVIECWRGILLGMIGGYTGFLVAGPFGLGAGALAGAMVGSWWAVSHQRSLWRYLAYLVMTIFSLFLIAAVAFIAFLGPQLLILVPIILAGLFLLYLLLSLLSALG